MTEEGKKEFEEFLQWKAEKKKKEEEEKREQEEAEKQVEQAEQERITAEQAKLQSQAANSSNPTKWVDEKSGSDKFMQKIMFLVCTIMIAALLIILAKRDHKPNFDSKFEAEKVKVHMQDSLDAIQAAEDQKEALRLDSIRKANRIDKVKHSIKIIKAYLSSPNSAGGVDAHLVWKNVSKKTIKYLNWSGYPINAVGDPVSCEIRGISESGGKVTGPIKPGTTYGYGKYWECVWYNYSAKKLILTGIDIEYMDGSTMRINQNELKYIR